MTKVLFLFIVTILFLNAEDTEKEYPGLSASVINVASNDVLNVREEPNYRSKKVGSWSHEANIIIDYCLKIKKSIWCKAEPDYIAEDGGYGWVNAYYLKFYNHGLVRYRDPKGEGCLTALKCEKHNDVLQCLINDGYYLDEKYQIKMQSRWIDRSLLIAGTMLSAANNSEMCGNSRSDIEKDEAKKLLNLYKKDDNKAYRVVIELLRILGQPDFRENSLMGIEKLIHPKKGVIITDMVSFGNKDEQHFDQKSFIRTLDEDKEILWGYTYGEGGPIQKSLYSWLYDAHREMRYISKIDPLDTFKNFSKDGYSELKAYEVYWINDESKTKEYDWLGLVVILAKNDDGKWYIAGLMRDRWTI